MWLMRSWTNHRRRPRRRPDCTQRPSTCVNRCQAADSDKRPSLFLSLVFSLSSHLDHVLLLASINPGRMEALAYTTHSETPTLISRCWFPRMTVVSLSCGAWCGHPTPSKQTMIDRMHHSHAS